MSDGVHLLIPFAASQQEGCREAAQTLELPQLQRLVGRLQPSATDAGDERSLSPPHERVLAAASALAAPDGCVPWAAWQVQQERKDEGGAGDQAWAWITPCHWHVATDHIVMKHPLELRLDGEDSQALLAAMQPFSPRTASRWRTTRRPAGWRAASCSAAWPPLPSTAF
jgi:hypothetical protein